MDGFPLFLRHRLCEESHIRVARRTIDEHIARLEAELAQKRDGVTSVDFLLAVAKRPSQTTQAVRALQEEILGYKQAQAVVDTIAAKLAIESENLTEAYLRETSEAYVRGLAAFENTGDWERALDRFEERMAAFIRELGEARNTASANYNRAQDRISEAGEAAIYRAANAAVPVEMEANFINELVDAHERHVRGTPAAGANFPRVPVGDYSHWTKRLMDMPIAAMQMEFERILTLCETLQTAGIPQLRQAIGKIKSKSRDLSRSYVLAYLSSLRQFSDKNWYRPEESEALIAELEKRYELAPKDARGGE